MIISKDAEGNVAAVELSEASPEEAAALAVLVANGRIPVELIEEVMAETVA